jgi:hypothetical protein
MCHSSQNGEDMTSMDLGLPCFDLQAQWRPVLGLFQICHKFKMSLTFHDSVGELISSSFDKYLANFDVTPVIW